MILQSGFGGGSKWAALITANMGFQNFNWGTLVFEHVTSEEMHVPKCGPTLGTHPGLLLRQRIVWKLLGVDTALVLDKAPSCLEWSVTSLHDSASEITKKSWNLTRHFSQFCFLRLKKRNFGMVYTLVRFWSMGDLDVSLESALKVKRLPAVFTCEFSWVLRMLHQHVIPEPVISFELFPALLTTEAKTPLMSFTVGHETAEFSECFGAVGFLTLVRVRVAQVFAPEVTS